LPRKEDFGRSAPLATVLILPKSRVSHCAMRLVSVSSRVRKINPLVRSLN
jgi:hypothetical protein